MIRTLVFAATICSCFIAKAQIVEDPLQKPEIWAELKETPLDEILWGKYLAKAYVCMSAKEREMIFNLRNKLMLNKSNPTTQTPMSKEEETKLFDNYSSGKKKLVEQIESMSTEKHLTNAYIADIEKLIIREPMSLVKLKQNPIENFWIIDDAYRSEFQSMGLPFRGFREENPDGKGNKMAWIKAKERELLAAKREIFEKIRAQVANNP